MRWSRFVVPALALAIGAAAGAGGVSLAAPAGVRIPTGRATAGTSLPADQMMGGGGAASPRNMMGGASEIAPGASGGLVPASRLKTLARQAAQTVRRRGSILTYNANQVTIVALGAPGNRPGMYWQIDGVDGPRGPTVSVPATAQITVDFADGDPGHPHGFEITTAAPPYPRMAMMAGSVATAGAFIMPVPAPKSDQWYAATASFHAPKPGTYYIICPVPGHAEQGMWARLVVR